MSATVRKCAIVKPSCGGVFWLFSSTCTSFIEHSNSEMVFPLSRRRRPGSTFRSLPNLLVTASNPVLQQSIVGCSRLAKSQLGSRDLHEVDQQFESVTIERRYFFRYSSLRSPVKRALNRCALSNTGCAVTSELSY